MNSLTTFHAIVGLDFLKEIGAKIDLDKGCIFYDKISEKLKFSNCADVNHIHLTDKNIPNSIKEKFSQVIEKNSQAFADPNEALPYNTNIVATICIQDNKSLIMIFKTRTRSQ